MVQPGYRGWTYWCKKHPMSINSAGSDILSMGKARGHGLDFSELTGRQQTHLRMHKCQGKKSTKIRIIRLHRAHANDANDCYNMQIRADLAVRELINWPILYNRCWSCWRWWNSVSKVSLKHKVLQGTSPVSSPTNHLIMATIHSACNNYFLCDIAPCHLMAA